MEKGSIVPNLFFDLIARVTPGAVLIVAVYDTSGWSPVQYAQQVFVPLHLRDEVIPWVITVGGSAFVLGHLLSPFVEFLLKRIAPGENTKKYNRLRARRPSVAVFATRIRSEATMYGGLAGAIAIGCVMGLWKAVESRHLALSSLPRWMLGVLVVVVLVMRYRRVRARFDATVAALWREASAAPPEQPT